MACNKGTYYRPDIDGLRALAVLAVILFHADIPFFSGGFVGVDIFFVISGFLITSILLREHGEGRFKLRSFYERRIRRIFPALFVVLAATTLVAWNVLLPIDMVEYAKSLLSTVFFSSNIYFSRDIGYFATAAEYKPLLHSWTLALEEQYYLFFPLFLMVVWRVRRLNSALVPLLWAGCAVSFAIACWSVERYPSYSFYLLPSRAWEFLIGALIAIYLPRPSLQNAPSALLNLASFGGVVMVILAIVLYDKQTPFPGVYTLLPVLGAALIIGCSRPRSLCYTLLSWKLAVMIGLISYSAYLWHYPLFSFYRIHTANETDVSGFLWLIAATFALAFLSWKYVETPFRDAKRVKAKTLYIAAVVASVLTVLVAAALWKGDGLGEVRFTDQQRHVLASVARENLDSCIHMECDIATISRDDMALIGDSNAYHFSVLLSEKLAERDVQLVNATLGGCPPATGIALGTAPVRERERCDTHNQRVREFLLDADSPQNVMIAAAWELYVYGDTPRYGTGFQPANADQFIDVAEPDLSNEARITRIIERMIEDIRWVAARKNHVYLVLPIPYLKGDLPRTIQGMMRGPEPYDAAVYLDANAELFAAFGTLRAVPNITLITPHEILCEGGQCIGKVDDTVLYGDRYHYSAAGSRLLLAELFERIAQEVSAR